LKTRLNNQAPAGPVYIDWVKQNLRENKPYDQVVRELLTAEGYSWDNPAVGYYLRDPGMPLDNMANTVQIFLGTRLQCAQCHDHPFDQWSQKDFYHMAAFTYGVNTRKPYFMDGEVRKARMIAQRKGLFKGESRRTIQRSTRNLIEPLIYGAHETGKEVRLPKDYQYDNARPRQVIEPRTMFGEEADAAGNSRDAYAAWMTSSENPRFALVIANRMWKHVMGLGLIEPVDDMKEGTAASIPPLMDYLTELMVDVNYDLKQFQRILYNTDAYQRKSCRTEIDPGKPFYFPGPLLRRMTAEQIWDSTLTLMIEDLDKRRIPDPQTFGIERRHRSFETRAAKLETMEAEELVDALTEVVAIEKKYAQRGIEVREAMSEAGTMEEKAAARRKVGALRRDRYREMSGLYGEEMAGGDMKGEMIRQAMERRRKTGKKGFDPRWRGFPREMIRASEVSSPAPAGHFLRQFGQSDREVIQNANDEASIPQALTLLNGKSYQLMSSGQSLTANTFRRTKNALEELDVLFLSVLNRYPDPGERELFAGQVEDLDRKERFNHTLWVLLNSQEFRFIQ
ncbi:MAG: DUF1553 domain-containing protein, partial [Verrucomicrobiota bacterium]